MRYLFAYALRTLLCVSALTSVIHLSAEPRFSTLDDVIAASPYIVVATYMGHAGETGLLEATAYRLRVHSTLRGDLHGEISVGRTDGYVVAEQGAQIVAFITADMGLKAVGEVIGALPLESGPIRLRGFYDFNAHVVSPSVVTLDGLRSRINGKPLAWRIEGPLVALTDDGRRIEATQWTIEVAAREGEPTTVNGLPAAASLQEPHLTFGPLNADDVGVVFNAGGPRPFVLHGTFTGERGGVLLARFRVALPNLLRHDDIDRYLLHRNTDSPYFLIRAIVDNGEIWEGSVGDKGRGPIFVTPDGVLEFQSFSLRGERYFEGSDRYLAFDPPREGVFLDTYGDTRVMMQELLRGPIGFTIESGIGAGNRGEIELTETEFPPAFHLTR